LLNNIVNNSIAKCDAAYTKCDVVKGISA